MATLRELRAYVQARIESDDTSVADKFINIALGTVTKRQQWDALRVVDSVTVNTGVIIAPVLARKITGVFTQDDVAERFLPAIRKPSAGVSDVVRRLVPTGYSTTVLQSGLTLTTTAGSATVTQAAASLNDIPASCENQRLVVSNDNGVYEIQTVTAATSLTISPVATQTIASASAWIGTNMQRMYTLYDSDNALTSETAVNVEYQMRHPVLTNANDETLIDTFRSVALRAIQEYLYASKYDGDARGMEKEIVEADADELGMETTNLLLTQRRNSMFAVNARNRYTSRW